MFYMFYLRKNTKNNIRMESSTTTNDSEVVWEEDNSDLDDWGKDLYTPSH